LCYFGHKTNALVTTTTTPSTIKVKIIYSHIKNASVSIVARAALDQIELCAILRASNDFYNF
jgi:hypothetical protein